MKQVRCSISAILGLMMLLGTAMVNAGVAVGENFPTMAMEDQFGKLRGIDKNHKIVLVSFSMETSEYLNGFLSQQPKGFLAAQKAAYIADISGMPSLITKLFALPKMRDYKYPLMLNREKGLDQKLDSQEGKITVYSLDNGVVSRLEFIDGKDLAEIFQASKPVSSVSAEIKE